MAACTCPNAIRSLTVLHLKGCELFIESWDMPSWHLNCFRFTSMTFLLLT